MGFGTYDEDKDQQDDEVNLDDTGETLDQYDGELEYKTESVDELLDTFKNEVKDEDEEA